MVGAFTLQYWLDDRWYVGRLKEVPSVFSPGESLEELQEDIRDAYDAMFGRPENDSTLRGGHRDGS